MDNILQNTSEHTDDFRMDLDKNTKDYYNLDMATKNDIQQDGSAQKYTRRNIMQQNYYEGEEPANNRYVYCDNCKADYIDFCSNCGALVVLEDTPIRMGVEMRAKKTVPKGILEVQPSKIHGSGVFALRGIPKGVRLGPYQGQITRVDSTKGYAWKLKDGRLVDVSDETTSNYLRYVNCAHSIFEQNVIAFQYQGQLYYITSKIIFKGKELLVYYYGPSYAKQLDIDPKQYFIPREEKSQPIFFTCQYCYIGLSTEYFRNCHENRCKFRPKRLIVVCDSSLVSQYCKDNLKTKEVSYSHEEQCPQKKQTKYAGEEDNATLCDETDFKKKQERTKRKAISLKNNKENVELETTPKKNKNEHYLRRHQDEAVEIPSKIYTCEICPFKTTNTSHFNNHNCKGDLNRYNCKGDDRSKFCCSHCKYVGKYKSHFVRHLRIHVGQKPFACLGCNKRFNEKQKIDNHILTKHNDNQLLKKSITAKIWVCSICNYKTTIKPHYDRHLLNHSQETPHVCCECKKGFKQNVQLQSHILSYHSNNEPLMKVVTCKIHTCEICNKFRTINKTHFKRHLKIHLK